MLKAIETDNVIKNIIREIIRECASKGINVSDTCAAYVIKLLVLNPEHGFISDRPLKRDDVHYLVKLCVNKLCQTNSASLATMKMQVYFDANYAPRDELIAENHVNVKSRTAPLVKEIIETITKTKDDLDKLYRKLVVAVILSSGLGNPTHIPVLKEATAALQSVFPPAELGQFMALSRKEKEQQIQELTQIVTGIRLFNRDCQKGGEGIDDLPNLLQQANTATQETLQTYLQQLMDHVDMLTTALDNSMKGSVISEYKSKISIEPKSSHSHREEESEEEEEIGEEEVDIEVTKEHFDFFRESLATARQQEVYIRKLLADVDLSSIQLKNLLDHLQRRLLQIHDTVRFRTAIPTVQVFPQFIDLSEVWIGLQDEMVLLSNINNISWSLQGFTQVLDTLDYTILKILAGDLPVMSDAARLEATTGYTIDSEGMVCEVVDPSRVADFDHIPLQYLGFCAWALVNGEGTLIPGNPNMGLCCWNGLYYVFSSLEAAAAFGKNPERYVAEALTLVRMKPELVSLLQLQEQIAAQKHVGEVLVRGPEPKIKCDSEVQTELHPIPSYIDPNYTWNEWQLKQKAIQLTNITKALTHSTQTYKSHMRMSLGIQTMPLKNVCIQTNRDNSSNVPKLQNFIFGLRGRKDDKQHVITLTRPVQE